MGSSCAGARRPAGSLPVGEREPAAVVVTLKYPPLPAVGRGLVRGGEKKKKKKTCESLESAAVFITFWVAWLRVQVLMALDEFVPVDKIDHSVLKYQELWKTPWFGSWSLQLLRSPTGIHIL